jgi:competence protein ComEC
LPGANVETPPLPVTATLLSVALLLAAAASPVLSNSAELRESALIAWQQWKKRRAWRPQPWIALALLFLALWAGRREWELRHAPLRVTVLDVGQGEAIIIRSPMGRTVLIDGGSLDQRNNVGRAVIVPYLQSIGAQRLDALVLTHADADHCNALPAVLREIPVTLALDGAANPEDAIAVEYQQVREVLRRQNVPRVKAQSGQRLDLGGGAILTVLAPLEPKFDSDNDNAVVLRLDYGKTSFLFTADIEAAAEARLAQRGLPLNATILKVAHHGSKSSSTPPFLRAAAPRAALISCGRYNPFQHPAASTLGNLARRRVPVFRTDLHGALEVTSDGNTCLIQTYR